MKFGPVATKDALGCVLAHSVALPSGRLKKGQLLTGDDVAVVRAAGIESLIVAELGPLDVREDDAAGRLANLLAGDHIRADDPFTGRANLYARQAGVLLANRDVVDAFNRVDPAITIACLPDDTFVEADRMVGTVKIIPLAVDAVALEAAEEVLSGETAIDVSPSLPNRVGLIATQLPHLKSATMDKTRRILDERLAVAGSRVAMETRVPHSAADVATALRGVANESDLIIIFGASAIADQDDVIPSALREAGGVVRHVGMPVDPGNLLMTGALDTTPVIGAPGCARSPAENGFDWVLQRLLAQLPVDDAYLTGLGVGGLLMEIHSRPQPRQ